MCPKHLLFWPTYGLGLSTLKQPQILERQSSSYSPSPSPRGSLKTCIPSDLSEQKIGSPREMSEGTNSPRATAQPMETPERQSCHFILEALYRDQRLCDGSIYSDGREFSIHRCVLGAVSPVLRTRFENGDSRVEVESIDLARAFR